MASNARRSRQSQPNIWPGFVDALATLLMVIIFLLMIFILAQFFLNEEILGRDKALQRLEGQVSELADLLSLERRTNTDLRINVSQLSEELQASVDLRDGLSLSVDTLSLRTAKAEEDAQHLSVSLEDAFKTIIADRGKIEGQVQQLAALTTNVQTLHALKKELERDISTMASRLAEAESLRQADQAAIDEATQQLALLIQDISALRELRSRLERDISALSSQLAKANTKLVEESELLRIARSQLAKKDAVVIDKDDQISIAREQLENSRAGLRQEKEISDTARAQLALLNRQMATLRNQLHKLAVMLEASETLAIDQRVEISSLGSRLNAALASKVQELSHYRSEFFGRLRKVLGDQPGIRIVGDRFVFQSEVLFDTGSAEIGEEGRLQLDQLGETLAEISLKIPSEINWILRVDGHTDSVPIATSRYPSNWELSSARAISVIKFLINNGIHPDRLAATGFGEFQPLDPDNDTIARRSNRRIEIKLTER
jgi:chemotaxis protein MotB